MTPGAWAGLLGEELRRGVRRAAMVSAGLVVGVAALVYIMALGAGVRRFVVKKLIHDLPAEEILVEIPETDVGPLRLGRSSLLTPAKSIDDEVFENIKNIEVDAEGRKIKPVKVVWRRMDAAFPASISGHLFGMAYGSDTAISGVDPGMVTEDVIRGDFTYKPGEEDVPALIPEALLDVYNAAFARSQGLPGLNPSYLIGKHFNMHLGSSSIAHSSRVIRRRAVIVGLTERGTLLGVSVPIGYVQEWNRIIGREGSADAYGSLLIELADARHVPAVSESVRKMGFRARSSTGLAERVSGIVTMITAGLGLLAIVILAVAGLNAWGLFKLAAWERRAVAGLWMALGAAPGEVRTLLMAEAVAVGAGAGAMGGLIALGACSITNHFVSRAAMSIPLFPSQLAVYHPGYALIGVALAVFIAVVAAWPNASRLARTDPAEILASQR